MSTAPLDPGRPVYPARSVLPDLAAAGDAAARCARSAVWQLSDTEVTEAIGQLLQVQARLTAARARLVREAEGRCLQAQTQSLSTQQWLQERYRLSHAHAGSLLREARGYGDQPAAEQALVDGAATPEQPQVIAQTLHDLPPVEQATRADAQSYLVAQAATLGPRDLARAGRALHEALTHTPHLDDPAEQAALDREADAADTHAQQRAARGSLRITRAPGGGSRSRLDLGALETAALLGWLGTAATKHPGTDGFQDDRSLEQRRADAVLTLVRHALDREPSATSTPDPGALADPADGRPAAAPPAQRHAQPPLPGTPDGPGPATTDQGRRPSGPVQVVVTTTLTGLITRLAEAGALATGGVCTPGQLRMLACDAHVVPAVLDGDSQVLDLGRATPTWNTALRRGLALRDRGCVAPGCDRPPAACDCHHRRHWADGSPTDLHNGALLCAHHHQQVHRQGWKVILAPNGFPALIPPASIDPTRRPRQHHRFRLTLLTARHRG